MPCEMRLPQQEANCSSSCASRGSDVVRLQTSSDMLDVKHFTQLLVDSFRCSRAVAAPLAALLLRDTRGNPLLAQDAAVILSGESDLVRLFRRAQALGVNVLPVHAGRARRDALVPEVHQKMLQRRRRTGVGMAIRGLVYTSLVDQQ